MASEVEALLALQEDDARIAELEDRMRSLEPRNSYTSRWRYTWLPVVSTSMPESSSLVAVRRVIPSPPATFSPFAITRSGR